MKERTESRYSVLIVSSSEQFNTVVKKVLPDRRFDVIEVRKSASSARRELLVRDYDVVIINAPLQDGMGTDFVMDLVEKNNAGIIFAVPTELYCNANDHLIEYGVLTIAKPVKQEELERMVKLLVAMNDRLRRMKKKLVSLTEKMDELRLVSRAKLLLVEKGMSEKDAHEHIIREAMNRGMTKKQVAEEIVE
ncbi:MAG: ANTAR domain-containing protein [Bacteroidales bacterium]|nr:ANTAR domain-containing protein [Bacteroidales bacterium]